MDKDGKIGLSPFRIPLALRSYFALTYCQPAGGKPAGDVLSHRRRPCDSATRPRRRKARGGNRRAIMAPRRMRTQLA